MNHGKQKMRCGQFYECTISALSATHTIFYFAVCTIDTLWSWNIYKVDQWNELSQM